MSPYKDPGVRKAKAAEYSRRWYERQRAADPEFDKKRRAKFIKDHPDFDAKRKRKFRAANPGMAVEQNKEWRRRNPTLHKAANSLQQHKARGFIVEIPSKDLAIMFDQTDHCPLCGTEFKEARFKTVDRIKNAKIMKRGTIRVICLACNNKTRGEKL